VGFDNLTISALAQRLGVKQPTLYKHVTGTSGLHRDMAVLAELELADVMRRSAVGKSGDDAGQCCVGRDPAQSQQGSCLGS